MNHKKLEVIKEKEIQTVINEEYQRAKRILNPMLKGINRSSVRFYWGKRMKTYGGWCNWYNREITMSHKYRDVKEGEWSWDNFILTLRHELAHLAVRGTDPSHGAKFLMTLKNLQGHRFVGQPIYEGPKKK
jgi:hypothetical protein